MATKKEEKPKRDFRQDLTEQIITLIEQGAAPWQKPWNPDVASAFLEMPHNATTGRAYRGGNSFGLMARAHTMGSDDPRWCTYKQANAEGWQVRKGEKGTGVEYWQFEKEEDRLNPATGRTEKIKVKLENPHVFYATVFHASQLDGIPAYKPRERPDGWNPVEEADRILANSGARIFHDQQDTAYYDPTQDDVHLPPREAFPQPLDYYEVAMHELGHWTGHPDRLNRDLSGSFGSESYAREELRAQMASLYLSAELGVPFNPERHAAYQASWVKVLNEDKNEIFRAARDAEIMADYVIDLAREKTLEQAQQLTANIEHTPAVGTNQEKIVMENQAAQSTQEVSKVGITLIDDQEANSIRHERVQLDGSETYNVSFYSGSKAVAKFKELDADALVDIVGEKNAAAIMQGEAKGILKGETLANEYGVSPEENQRRVEAKELRKGVELASGNDVDNQVDLSSNDKEANRKHAAEMTRNLMGADAKFYSPGANATRHYDGPFVYSNHNYAVQKNGEDVAIVHDLDKLDRNAADQISKSIYSETALRVSYEAGKDIAKIDTAPTPEQAREQLTQGDTENVKERNRKDAAEKTRSLLGAETKLYSPRADAARQYDGTFVYLNHDYAVQKIGKNAVIVHDLDKLDRDVAADRISKSVNFETALRVTYEVGQDIAKIDAAPTPEQARERLAQGYAEVKNQVTQKFGAEAKVYIPNKNAQEYKGQVIFVSDTHVVQQVGKNAAISHLRSNFDEVPTLDGGEMRIAYKDGKMQVRTSQAQETELQALKNEHMGKNAKLEFAHDNTGRNEYDGPIVAETGSYVIQKINDQTAVVHAKTNLQKDVEVGDNLAIVYDHGKVYAEGLSADREREKKEHAVEANGQSTPEAAREQVRKRFPDAKITDAKYIDVDQGNYTGTVIAQDDKSVIQRIGANKFISHDRSAIDQGKDTNVGQFVKVQYAQGRAQVQSTQRQQQQGHERGPDRELAH